VPTDAHEPDAPFSDQAPRETLAGAQQLGSLPNRQKPLDKRRRCAAPGPGAPRAGLCLEEARPARPRRPGVSRRTDLIGSLAGAQVQQVAVFLAFQCPSSRLPPQWRPSGVAGDRTSSGH
jgi:hypothetical protein